MFQIWLKSIGSGFALTNTGIIWAPPFDINEPGIAMSIMGSLVSNQQAQVLQCGIRGAPVSNQQAQVLQSTGS